MRDRQWNSIDYIGLRSQQHIILSIIRCQGHLLKWLLESYHILPVFFARKYTCVRVRACSCVRVRACTCVRVREHVRDFIQGSVRVCTRA